MNPANKFLYNNDIIFTDFKKAQKLIELLNLSSYTKKHNVFTVNILNKTIIIASDKLSEHKRHSVLTGELNRLLSKNK